ncbi:helix-turn-helix domain-containing protein [Planctomycetota bacterium]
MGRAPSTVEGYLVEWILEAAPEGVDAWVDESTYAQIEDAAGEVGTAFLRPIFERLGGTASYACIRAVLAHLEVRNEPQPSPRAQTASETHE